MQGGTKQTSTVPGDQYDSHPDHSPKPLKAAQPSILKPQQSLKGNSDEKNIYDSLCIRTGRRIYDLFSSGHNNNRRLRREVPSLDGCELSNSFARESRTR
ncbi:hypothetical protein ETB97_005051 [Aspergillus alliaceus]|uniref:Uncharacterized protein n=1 Tax=Petromyces alliaceus TaxID=209559 RepID=A0A8H6AB42_PETAA|nr:hypothetical protein ETB97_005051 [Aspergillus burnettii]